MREPRFSNGFGSTFCSGFCLGFRRFFFLSFIALLVVLLSPMELDAARKRGQKAGWYPVENSRLRGNSVLFRQVAKKGFKSLVLLRSLRAERQGAGTGAPFLHDGSEDLGFDLAPINTEDGAFLGTGVLLDSSGLVMTPYSVIQESDQLLALLADQKGTGFRSVTVTVLGVDRRTDLALLQLKMEELMGDTKSTRLHAVEFGDSERLRMGDWVVSVGNSLGYFNAMSAGVLSGRSSSRLREGLIQSDTRVPGPGAILLNTEGELVGLHTAMWQGNMGFSTAIPSNVLQRYIRDLSEYGEVRQGWIGVQVQGIPSEMARELGIKEGALVRSVFKDSPADQLGIERGDVIVQLGRFAIRRVDDLSVRLDASVPGDEEKIVILRPKPSGTRQRLEWQIRILGSPESGYAYVSDQGPVDGLGLRVLEDDGALLVALVAGDSPGERAGLQAGDLIKEVGGNVLTALPEYQAQISQLGPGEQLLLLIERDGLPMFVGLVME